MAGRAAGSKGNQLFSDIVVNGVLALICLVWTIPTVGLLVSSFRTRDDIQTSGWWTILPHREWKVTEEYVPEDGQDTQGVMTYSGVSGTFEELRGRCGGQRCACAVDRQPSHGPYSGARARMDNAHRLYAR